MVKNQLQHAHKSKDDRKQTKTTGLISKDTEINWWPCVHQVYLVPQGVEHIKKCACAYISAWSQLEQWAKGTFIVLVIFFHFFQSIISNRVDVSICFSLFIVFFNKI